MMSSSKVIKPVSALSGESDILTSEITAMENDSFQALDSLWRDQDGNVASLAGAQEQRKILLAEAKNIIAQAHNEADRIEKEAYTKGFEAGQAAVQQEGTQKMAEIAAFLKVIEDERKTLYKQYEQDALTLVKALVDKLVNHEVSVNPRVINACLEKALGYVIENSRVTVHLHSVDFGRLKEAALEDPGLLEGFRQLELVEDPSLSLGGCMLETEFGEIDATMEKRKEKLFAALDTIFMQSLAASDQSGL